MFYVAKHLGMCDAMMIVRYSCCLYIRIALRFAIARNTRRHSGEHVLVHELANQVSCSSCHRTAIVERDNGLHCGNERERMIET